MSMKALTLGSLGELSPKIAEAFDTLMRRATADCYDRPADGTARKVSLEVAFTPVMDQDGQCNEVAYQFFFAAKIPKFRTKLFSGAIRPNGAVLFNPDAPDNVNQSTFLGPDDEDA